MFSDACFTCPPDPRVGDRQQGCRSNADRKSSGPGSSLPVTASPTITTVADNEDDKGIDMPTPTKGPRLGGSPQHERLILRNLAQSLFEHGKIATTEAKAKRLRPYAEKLITTTKRGDLHARREILKVIRDKNVVHKMFAEIGPSFATREGGYTRIVKIAPRKGDNAPMAIIELVAEETVSAAAGRVARRAASTRTSTTKTTSASSGSSPAVVEGADPAEGADIEGGAVIADADHVSQAEQAVNEAPAEGSVEAGVEAAVGASAEPDAATQAEQAVNEAPSEGSVQSGTATDDQK